MLLVTINNCSNLDVVYPSSLLYSSFFILKLSFHYLSHSINSSVCLCVCVCVCGQGMCCIICAMYTQITHTHLVCVRINHTHLMTSIHICLCSYTHLHTHLHTHTYTHTHNVTIYNSHFDLYWLQTIATNREMLKLIACDPEERYYIREIFLDNLCDGRIKSGIDISIQVEHVIYQTWVLTGIPFFNLRRDHFSGCFFSPKIWFSGYFFSGQSHPCLHLSMTH